MCTLTRSDADEFYQLLDRGNIQNDVLVEVDPPPRRETIDTEHENADREDKPEEGPNFVRL